MYSDHYSKRGTESDSDSMADDETRGNDYDSDLEYEDFNPRTMRDFNVPRVGDVRGAIRLPRIVGNQPNLNSGVVNMIQQNLFYGMDYEDPHAHIQSFLEYCATIRANGATTDYIRLAMFPFTLRDKAKKWLGSLPRGSIGTWKELSNLFLSRFFPHRRTAQVRAQLNSFRQKYDEPLNETWERFIDLQYSCPHHGIPNWLLIQTFYDGLTERALVLPLIPFQVEP